MTHPATLSVCALFLLLAAFMCAANIWLFRPITQHNHYGFLIIATEMVSLAFIIWATLLALFIAVEKPITAALLITLATWMWLDRAALAIGGWL